MIRLFSDFIKRRRRNRLLKHKPIGEHLPEHLKIGIAGENAATLHYIRQGFDILERNYRLGKAELDIVAENKHYFVFCEVKSKKASSLSPNGRPMAAVDSEKRHHMAQAASYFARRYRKSGKRFRFDVIEVYLSDNLDVISLHHVQNAFTVNR